MVTQVRKLVSTDDTPPVMDLLGDDATHPSLAPLQPEWDVLNEIWHTVKTWSPFRVVHIKGHQDRHRSRHDLPLIAQLNVEADKLADHYLKANPLPKTEVLLFPHAHVQFNLHGATITSRYSLKIRNAECDPVSVQYLKTRHGWTTEVFNSINWLVHGKTVRSQQRRKNHITKLVNDLLPTNKNQHRCNPQHSPKCMQCQVEIETRDHLIRCPRSAEWRVNLMHALRKKCDKLSTAPSLRHLLFHGLQAWMSGADKISEIGFTGESVSLIRSQNKIGWRHLFNGRWSHLWAQIQGRFLHDTMGNGISPKGNKWNVAVIQELWEGWYILWKSRNALVHGDDAAAKRAAEVEMIRRRLRGVYALSGRVEPVFQSVLDVPLEDLLTKGLTYLKNWLAVYEQRLHSSARRQSTSDIRGMRPLQFYFGHIDDPG